MMNDRHFKIYTASAGSGKTYTLVKEFLTLSLSSNSVSCKDILAVTFTNKAANEMKAKILFNLDGIINDNSSCSSMKSELMNILNIDENTLKERANKLYDTILHNYSDFNISTIDGFVQQISRSFTKELNLPAQYRVLLDDDDLLDELIQSLDKQIVKENKYITEILTDFINFQLEEEHSLRVDVSIRDYVKKLLKESAYKKGESLNIKVLSDSEYQDVKKYLNETNRRYKKLVLNDIKEIRDVEDEFGIVQNDYNGMSRGLPAMLKKIENDINIEPSSLLTSTIKTILKEEKDWFSNKCNKKAVENIYKSGIDVLGLYKKLVEHHHDLFLVNLVRQNLYLYALRGLLLSIINQHIEETNKVHISEFNKRISDIIADCSVPFIYERIGSRFKHFFIDEFQDTSLLQWRNFLPLVNNSLSEGKMNLLVGDAKQAIYRFRSGEVEQIINLPYLYNAEKNDFTEECENNFRNNFDKKFLTYNYRSKKNIIDFNNSFFKLSKYRLTSMNYRSVYDDNLKQNCPKKYDYDGFVSVEIFDMSKIEDGRTDLYKDAVKKSILKDINRLILKNFNYSDITVLVRNNKDGSDIADFLSQNSVPVISSDSIALKSSDKVRLIILTLKYLSDDANDITNLTLSFYNNICKDPDFCDIQKALTETFDKEKIYEIRNQAYSLYDLCGLIIKMYGFNIVEDEFLQYFMNLVMEWQNSENKGVNAFVEYWDKKSDSFFVKITGKIDAVQIMTIHKSKGLEFKVVMYPYAYTKVPDISRGSEKWLLSEDLELLKDIPNIDSFILPVNKNLLDTSMEHHYREEVEKAAFDDFNIMYVAMTRPADAMFIYTNNKAKSDDDSYNFFVDYFSLPECGYAVADDQGKVDDVADDEDVELVKNRFEYKEGELSELYVLGDICYDNKADEDRNSVLELDGGNVPTTLEWTDVLKIEPDPTMFWAEDDTDYLPQEWGNLVHEILSKINTMDDAQNVLVRYVNDGCIDKQQAEKLQTQFGKIASMKEIAAAYSKEAAVRNEMDILIVGHDNTAAKNRILRPDRFAELDDKVILIDYKTGKHLEEYETKLREYVTALQDMGMKKNIEAYLLYLGENVEIKQVFLDRLF